MKTSELKKLIKEEIVSALNEADIVPVGPDGSKIQDPQVIKNLNMAIKAIDSSIRTKVIDLIEDPSAVKSLKNNAQRVALLGAVAIAFGITEQDFTQIASKLKGVLKQASNDQA
jgi:hypothetical protein